MQELEYFKEGVSAERVTLATEKGLMGVFTKWVLCRHHAPTIRVFMGPVRYFFLRKSFTFISENIELNLSVRFLIVELVFQINQRKLAKRCN